MEKIKRLEMVKLADIRLDGGTQPRAELDMAIVADYADLYQMGEEMPPLEVVWDGSCFWLWAGFHRYHAAPKAGIDQMECRVTDGTVADARWLAAGSNRANGTRVRDGDKLRVARMALAERPNESNRMIAHHCGVSEITVRRAREEMDATATMSQSHRRTGKDGRTIDTSKIGKRPAAPPPPPEPIEEPADDAPPADDPIIIPPAAPLFEDAPEEEPQPTAEPAPAPSRRADLPLWDDLLRRTYERVIAIENCEVSFAEMIVGWTPTRRINTASVLQDFIEKFEEWHDILMEGQA